MTTIRVALCFVAGSLLPLGTHLASADSTTVLISSSLRRANGLPASAGPAWNISLPTDEWYTISSLQDPGMAAAAAPSADPSLVDVLLSYDVPFIRHRFDPTEWTHPVSGPLGPIDVSDLEGVYEVWLADSTQLDLFCAAIDSLGSFIAEPPADIVGIDPDNNAGIAGDASALTPPCNDPMWSAQGYLHEGPSESNQLNLSRVWSTTKGDPSMIIAVIDSRVVSGHRDLRDREGLGLFAIYDSNYNHGTSVASIIGAVTNNSRSMAGILWDVTLINPDFQILPGTTPPTISEVFDELYKIARDGHAVIWNHSYYWGGDKEDPAAPTGVRIYLPRYYSIPHRALVNARNTGVIHLASAGNSRRFPINPPGSLDESVISMGALKLDGGPVDGTVLDRWADFAAQGEALVALEARNDTAYTRSFGYTSGAAAQGTGLAGLAYAYGLSVGDTLDADDIRGIFSLGLRQPRRVPRLDSAFTLMKFPNSLARYSIGGGWAQTNAQNQWFALNGVLGQHGKRYRGERRKLTKYVAYPVEYAHVYGVWANGPRSNGAMPIEASGVHNIITTTRWAQVHWWGAVGCSVTTYYYKDIYSMGSFAQPDQLIGDYPFSSANDASVTLTVVGQRRLALVNASISYPSSSDMMTVHTPWPAFAERVVVDRKSGAAEWETGYRILTGTDSSFIDSALDGSQTYRFRAHAETYNQVGPTGPEVEIVTRPNTPHNPQAAVIMRRYDEYTPTAVEGSGLMPESDSEGKAEYSCTSNSVASPADAGGGGGGPVWRPTNAIRLTFEEPLNQAVAPTSYIVRAWPEGVYCDDNPLTPLPPCPTPPGESTTIQMDDGIRAYEWYVLPSDGSFNVCLARKNWQYEVGVYAVGFDGQWSLITPITSVTTGNDNFYDCDGGVIPQASVVRQVAGFAAASVDQNYPNPFNAATIIRFQVAEPGHVSLIIYNVLGQRVRTLVDESVPGGIHEVTWDGRDEGGRDVASGVYLYRLQSDTFTETRRMAVVR